MASELSYRGALTGSVCYATIRNASLQMWNTSGSPAFESMTVANWANYAIVLSETPASSYLYVGTWPAGVSTVGWYMVDIFLRSGGSAAISDTLVQKKYGWWNGTAFEIGAADAKAVAGTIQTSRDLGASVLISNGTGTGQLSVASGVIAANQTQVNGHAVTDTTAGVQDVNAKAIANTVQTGAPILGTPANATLAADIAANATAISGIPAAVWAALSSTMTTVGSIGKKLADWVVGTITANQAVNVAQWGGSNIHTPAVAGEPVVTLEATQAAYAPAKAGDKMDIVDAPNNTGLVAIATAVWALTTRTLSAISDSSGITTLLTRISQALGFDGSGNVKSVKWASDNTGVQFSAAEVAQMPSGGGNPSTIYTAGLTDVTVANGKIYQATSPGNTQLFTSPNTAKVVQNSEFNDLIIQGNDGDGGGSMTYQSCIFKKCFVIGHYYSLTLDSPTIRDSKVVNTIHLLANNFSPLFDSCVFGDNIDTLDCYMTGTPEDVYIFNCGGELTIQSIGGGTTYHIYGGSLNITIGSSATCIVDIKGTTGLVINQSASATVTYNGVSVPNGTTRNIPAKVNDIPSVSGLALETNIETHVGNAITSASVTKTTDTISGSVTRAQMDKFLLSDVHGKWVISALGVYQLYDESNALLFTLTETSSQRTTS